MANTIVQLHALASLGALTLKIYPRVGGAIVNGASGDALTEDETVAGLYQATVTEALAGVYAARVLSGSDLIGSFLVNLRDDTNTYDLGDPTISLPLMEMVENDGGVYRLTTNAVEQAPSGGGGGDEYPIQPYSSSAPQRVTGTRITLFEDEFGMWVTVTSYSAHPNGRIPLDLTGKTLRFIVESDAGTVLATLNEASGVLEKVGDPTAGVWRFKATAEMSAAVAENDGANWWDLSDVTGGAIDETLAWGREWVQRRAGH